MQKFIIETFKFAPLLFIAFLMSEANASDPHLNCRTPRNFHQFKVIGNTIIIKEKGNVFENRNPASSESKVRTHRTARGFKKYFNHNDHRFYINIENTNKFSELDDFVTIRNGEGHEMTYPLNCKLLN